MASFRGYKRSIKLEFDYDQVKEGIPRVKKQMTILNAEFKKSYEEANATGNSLEKLGVRYDYLTERIKIHEKEVEEYRKKLEEARKGTGNNTKSIENNTTELRKSEAQLAQMKTALSTVTKEMEYQQNTVDKNSEEWKTLEYQLAMNDAQFQRTNAEADLSGKTINKLSAEHEKLTSDLRTQEAIVETYKSKLNEATQAEVKNEQAIKENKLELAKAEGQLAQTRAEIDKVTKELDSQKLILGKTSEEWNNLSESLNSTGKKMTVGITAPLMAAGGIAFKMSSDYEQALGKMETVFEYNSNKIETWAKDSIKNFGLAKSTATEMASDFGALFKGMGVSLDKSTEWSTVLTERVMDLSNFYDTTVEETNKALEAIVTGQTEPLRRFGINMNQAALGEYAWSKGIRKKIADMTEAEKVQLRYNFVIDKTNIAVGTTVREADSATGQINRMKEGVKELGQNFGDILLPMVLPFLETINSLLTTFNEFDEGTKTLIIRMLAFGATIGPTLSLLSKMIETVQGVTSKLGAAKDTIKAVKDAGGILSFVSTTTEGFGMAKLIGYALALAAALTLVALAFDLIFRGGQGVQNMMSSIGSVFNKQANQARGAINQAGKIPGYAKGTRNHPGGFAIVGEEGPELISMPRGSKVYTNQETNEMLGGGDTYILQVNMDEIDEVYKLINVFENFKQTKRAGVVNG